MTGLTGRLFSGTRIAATAALSALAVLAGCRPQAESNDWYIETGMQPLSFSLTQSDGGPGPVLDGGEHGALFYVSGRDTHYVSGPVDIDSDELDSYEASHSTTDGRIANVTLRRGTAGTMQLRFTVTPDSGIDRKGIMIEAREGEAYYGLMERVVDGRQDRSWEPGIEEALDLRGQELTMFVKPTLSIYEPFYVSSEGYGVFVEGTWPGEYDMAASDPVRVSFSFEGPELSVRFIQGPEPAAVVERFHEVAGRPFLPPRWAFSVYHWRDDHGNPDTLYDGTRNTGPYNAMLTEDMLMLEALEIPFGVYWVDRPWATGLYGYDDFKWDPERFPQAERMLDWIQRKEKRFLLWIAPWLMGDMLEVAEERGFLIPGSRYVNPENPAEVRQLLDFSNPDAVEWWGVYLATVIDDGVDAFKLDRSEELMPDSREIVLHSGNTAREEHNRYPLRYIRGAFEQARQHRGDENFLMMPRAAYTGSQQYGAFWGGDIATGPWGLRAALIAVQRSAFMGFPVWGSDTGGYWGDFELYTHENMARWLAFSCFTPIMEVGPVWNRALWDMPKEPAYDPALIATYRLYATIHTRLIDYSYNQARIASEQGTPIVRPMAMAFPGDEQAAAEWDQYLYGPDILVGVIWQNDVREHTVYLPDGEWRDAWTGEIFEGPQEVALETPRYKIPVFVRADSDLDLGDLEGLYRESLEIAEERPDLERLLREEEF